MIKVKGIISFPILFSPKVAKGATEPKYGVTVLLPPNDPQIKTLQEEVKTAKLNNFPSGYTGADECFGEYDEKYKSKDYYDNRFSSWWVLTCSAKEHDKPAVVDSSLLPITDPGEVYSGMIAWVNLNISGYTKGKGGIGGWLNGVMITSEESQFGRLDGKPTVEQMFANIDQTNSSPTPPAAVVPPPPPAPPTAQKQLTEKAQGQTYESLIAAGWTDATLIENGLMLPPGGVMPSFV